MAMMNMYLNCTFHSLNVRGLRESAKRGRIFFLGARKREMLYFYKKLIVLRTLGRGGVLCGTRHNIIVTDLLTAEGYLF